MEYTSLRGTGLRISRLSIGTWPFAGTKLWGEQDQREAQRLVCRALDEGINTFDTAAGYGAGESERVLGEALRGRRDRAVVCSKVQKNFLRARDVTEQCEGSLRRLGTDYLDLYQIHWASREIPLSETLEAMERLKAAGKIRAISVCNFGPRSLEGAAGHALAMNQLPWSLIWRVIEKNGVLRATERAGLPVWAYTALGQGLLTGKFRTVEDVPLGRRANRLYSSAWGQGRHTDGGFEEPVFALVDQLRQLCAQAGISMSALSLGFLKEQTAVGSVLMGVRSVEQLESNLRDFETPIPQEVLERAEELSRPLLELEGDNADLWENAGGGRMF